MRTLPLLKDAYLFIKDDTIVDFGKIKNCKYENVETIIDASGK